jgi:formate dehydrogenase subunit beta
MAADEKGALFTAEGGPREKVIALLQQALTKGCFDAVLIPVMVAGTDSFSYLLTRDDTLLKNAYPLPPIMTVQGAKAISGLTGHGKGKKKVAAVVRPCEARATVELFKLGQADLENIYLITIDCPGALPWLIGLKTPRKPRRYSPKSRRGRLVRA